MEYVELNPGKISVGLEGTELDKQLVTVNQDGKMSWKFIFRTTDVACLTLLF